LATPKTTDGTSDDRDSETPPEVHVEFFGIARQLAGCESISVEASTLADVITALSTRFPELGARCFRDQGLREQWLFNIEGRFIRETTFPLTADASVLLMSADAGG
jgi:molybdopterin converting factor small subunit